MTKLKVIYESNEFILSRKFFKNDVPENKIQQKKLKINLINFDSKFFYSLVYLSNRNIKFQISIVKFFSNIQDLPISKQYKNSCIEFVLDSNFFKNNFESFINFENPIQVKNLQITAFNLRNYDAIVLTW
jgi:hypothetical protein